MNKQELVELLERLAMNDLDSDADIYDHPCSVAIRAINDCFSDIESLQRMCRAYKIDRRGSKKMQHLMSLNYDPQW